MQLSRERGSVVAKATTGARLARTRGSALPRPKGRKKCAIPRNEPILFPGHFPYIRLIERYLRGLQSWFANGFVLENEPILGLQLGLFSEIKARLPRKQLHAYRRGRAARTILRFALKSRDENVLRRRRGGLRSAADATVRYSQDRAPKEIRGERGIQVVSKLGQNRLVLPLAFWGKLLQSNLQTGISADPTVLWGAVAGECDPKR